MTKFRLSLAVWVFPIKEKLRNVGSEFVPDKVLRQLRWVGVNVSPVSYELLRLSKFQGNVQFSPAEGSTTTHRKQSEAPFAMQIPTENRNSSVINLCILKLLM